MGDTKEQKGHCSRQKWLTGGIPRYSRSAMYRRTAMYKKKKTIVKKQNKPAERYVEKEIGGEKNGGKRKVLVNRKPRYYPTDEGTRKLQNNKKPFSQHKRKLRASITPGTVLILLAGNHRGRRVVFLKQLPSGLLLITGPFKVNGVPLRRVNQTYVIATSTKIDVSSVKIPDIVNDEYFRHTKLKSGKKKNLFDSKKEVYEASEQRKEDQKTVDDQVIPLVKANKYLDRYLQNHFSLRHRDYPHKMIF